MVLGRERTRATRRRRHRDARVTYAGDGRTALRLAAGGFLFDLRHYYRRRRLLLGRQFLRRAWHRRHAERVATKASRWRSQLYLLVGGSHPSVRRCGRRLGVLLGDERVG